MASSSRLCRLCEALVPWNRAVCLFNRTAVEQRLASRISNLLDVSVDANDGLPEQVCDKCKRRVETLERAAANLKRSLGQPIQRRARLIALSNSAAMAEVT